MAFADDLLIIAVNCTEAENALKALDLLKDCGLNINLKKTQIMSDLQDMERVDKSAELKLLTRLDTLGSIFTVTDLSYSICLTPR